MTVVTAMNPPIQANRPPTNVVKAPTTPRRAPRPRANSAIISGSDHTNRKITHGIKNAAPPF